MARYPDAFNPDLLERIPLAARTILDVGCATGSLGAAYRRLNPASRLLGIERDPESAATAASRLDEVAILDIEQADVPFDLPDGLDCIVYGDVLEHLVDPWAVLRRHADLLTPDGVMLLSVPNIEHWSFVARLLQGNWDYEDIGLLDRTHLRWFSLESMRRGLTECGLVPCDVAPRIFRAEQGRAFVETITPALEALDVDVEGYSARALPLQFVWRVRRRPPRTLRVVSTMMDHVGGVSVVRITDPMRAIATDPDIATHIVKSPVIPTPGPDVPKIFVLHRPVLAGENAVQLLRTLLTAGYVIVTEFDDLPDHFPALRETDALSFRGVHAVQSSTEPLGAILRASNPETVVFPNAIRTLPAIRNFADPRRMTLFFGGLNREADWEPYVPTLNAVAAMAGERLGFRIVHDRALFDALQTPHKEFTPTCDYDTYLDLLGRSEISFMPLADTPFNRAKSDLKFIEAGACRVAALASPVVYASSVKDGQTGVLFRTPDELRTALLRLITQPHRTQALGDAARTYVQRDRMLAAQVQARITWYRSLWDRRAELTAALLARTPELAHAPALSPVGE